MKDTRGFTYGGNLSRRGIVWLLAAVLLALTPLSAFAGTLIYGPPTTMTGPLLADGSAQAVSTVSVAADKGGANASTITVALGGTVTNGDVTQVTVVGSITYTSTVGSYGSGSVIDCIGTAGKPGNVTVNVYLASSAAGKSVSVSITADDTGTSTGLPATSGTVNIIAPPASNTYDTLISMSGPLTADMTQQTVATVPVTLNNGGTTVSSYTVNLTGTVTSGDVAGVYVTDGSNTWFSTGSYGSGSSVVCLGANAIPGATLSINVTLNASADTKTVAVTLQTDSNSAASLPKGPSTALTCSAPVGPPTTLADCAGCHNYPPVDAVSRDAATGNFIGDHDKHSTYTCATCHITPATETATDFAHRTGQLNMDSGNIGVGSDNGTYSKGATFAQNNTPTGGTCSLVDCHNNAVTPQWGIGTTACDTCHTLPPATNAHLTHYTAKGWATGATTNCTACHPDNTAGHSDVTDASVVVTAGLSYAGAGGSCSAPGGLGCHNDYATPNWSGGTATCASCHAVGGGKAADPTSGLHDETPTVSAVIHNPANANFASCETCHSATPSSAHWDGTLQTTAPTIAFAAGVGFTDGAPATCTAATCHSDGGAWRRKWHEDSNLTTGAECAGCHGDWVRGWNTGVTHRTDANPQGTHGTGTTYQCKDCHALEAASGYTFTLGTNDWGGSSKHGDGLITINSNGTNWARGTGGNSTKSGCSACHLQFDGTAAGQHSFTVTSWTAQTVSGDSINAGCDSCHGGSGQYWPNGTTYPDTEERHDEHMAKIAAKLGITLPGDDLQQKRMCAYCHPDPGGSGHSTNSGDSVADVNNIHPIWDATNPPSVVDSGAAFSSTDGSCASIDCHNNKSTGATTFGWRNAGVSTCTMCHVGGTTDGTSGLHTGTPTVSGKTHNNTLDASGCVVCHTTSPSSSHISGTVETSSPTIALAAGVGFTDGATPTCTASTCHSDGGAWQRKWSTTAMNSNGTECAGCHGDWVRGWNVGVKHRTDANPRTNHGSGTNYECSPCHNLEASAGYTFTSGTKDWGTEGSTHGDGNIQINSNGSTFARGTGGSTGLSGCSACHGQFDGTTTPNHSFQTTSWTLATAAGDVFAAECTACHASGKSGAIVTSASRHVITTVGGTFNACTDCHPGGSVGSMHSATSVIGVPNNTTVGINYQNGISGGGAYSGYAGIVLGGDAANAAPAASEAEWCWQCHAAQATDISEWDGRSAAAKYNYGSVTANNLNWTTTTWNSAVFSYKNGALNTAPGTQTNASTHGTKGGSAGVDSVANIGCSYCHDVHNTYGPSSTTANMGPFLRGNWVSNPFKEDGAPGQPGSVATWTNSFARGNLPRATASLGGTANNEYGGWQTEDNNTYTRTGNATTHAGLCLLCHTEASLKTAWNSHANIVDGFTPSGALDIFDVSHRMNTTYAEKGGVLWAYPHHLGVIRGTNNRFAYASGTNTNYIEGYRDGNNQNDSFMAATAGKPNNGAIEGLTAHVATLTGNVVDANFHQFPCSKCHNPHASRLPKLMISNCLDVQNNTWDNTLNPASWNPTLDKGGTKRYGTTTQLAYSTTAGNCHRYVKNTDTNKDDGQKTSTRTTLTPGSGWNKVTPW